MSTWFKCAPHVSYGSTEISAVEVERSTESSVWIKGRRRSRISDFYHFYPTWEEAREAVLKTSQRRIDELRLSLEKQKGYHGKIVGMKKPE